MLALEPLLHARLAAVPGLKGVHGLSDLAAEKTKPTPCVYVVYDGGQVLEQNAGGVEARVALRWLVVLAVKNVRSADGAAAREDAQPLASAVLAALMGWRPDASHTALHLVDLPHPEFSDGLLWLPMAFQTTQIMKGH